MITTVQPISDQEKNTYETERRKPMPSFNHSLIEAQLSFLLKTHYRKDFFIAAELSLGFVPKGATPDICILPKKDHKIGVDPDIIKLKEAPITTIEILSPTQALSDLTNKIKNEYFPNGVKSSWVIIPELRAVVVYQAGKKDYEWFKKGEMKDEVTGIHLKVDDIFDV